METREPSVTRMQESVDTELDSLVETFLSQSRSGRAPGVEAFAEQHPAHRTRLLELLPTLLTLEACAGEESLPARKKLPAKIGDYRVLDLLGRGGMGVVYLAQHPRLDRKVAIKVLPNQVTNDPQTLKRFQREANAIAQLQHPNIVTLYEIGRQAASASNTCDLHYFVMQYVEGASLDEVIRVGRSQLADASETQGVSLSATKEGEGEFELTHPFPRVDPSDIFLPKDRWQAIARIGIDAADGLAHAHDREVLHRDVKPSNLILDRDGKTWITDFGLAKLTNEEASRTDGVAGTLRFIAPERFRGWSDPRSDVYSLGITLYEIAAMQPAIAGNDRAEIIAKITKSRIKSPQSLVPDIPRDLETIICKAVSPSPDDRYETAAALRDDLRRFLDVQPIKAQRFTLLERTRQWARRNPSVAALLASIALFMAVITFGTSFAAISFNDLARELDQKRATATRSLFLAYISEAHARTTSNQPGQRTEALKAIEKAVELIPKVPHQTDDILHLRNEMITALTLADVEFIRESRMPFSISIPSPDFEYVASMAPDGLFQCRDATTGDVLWDYQFQGGEKNATSGNRFSPNSKYVAAFSYGTGRVRLFDTHSGAVVISHQATAYRFDGVEPIAFDRESRRFVVCCPGEPIRIFDTQNPSAAPKSVEVPFPAARAFFHGKNELIAYHPELRRGDLIVHDLPSRETKVVSTRHVTAVCWQPTRRGLLVGGANGATARVDWPEFDRNRFSSSTRSEQARYIEVSEQSGLIAVKCYIEDFRVCDAATGAHVLSLWGTRAKFSSNGDRLALSDDSQIQFYRVHSNQRYLTTSSVSRLGHHCPRINRRGDLMLATCGAELQLWNTDALTILDTHQGEALSQAAHFLPDGRVISVVDGKLAVFQLVHDARGTSLSAPDFLGAAFSRWVASAPEADRIAWQTPNGMLRIGRVNDLENAVEFRPRNGSTYPYYELSPDGKVLAIADGTIRLFDAETAKPIHDFGLATRGDPRSYFQFRPDGRQMICHTGAEQLLIDLQDRRVIKRFPTDGRFTGSGWSPDGSTLARAVDSETIVLSESDTFTELARIRLARPIGIGMLRFSRDGQSLLACVNKSQIYRWDLAAIRHELARFQLDW